MKNTKPAASKMEASRTSLTPTDRIRLVLTAFLRPGIAVSISATISPGIGSDYNSNYTRTLGRG